MLTSPTPLAPRSAAARRSTNSVRPASPVAAKAALAQQRRQHSYSFVRHPSHSAHTRPHTAEKPRARERRYKLLCHIVTPQVVRAFVRKCRSQSSDKPYSSYAWFIGASRRPPNNNRAAIEFRAACSANCLCLTDFCVCAQTPEKCASVNEFINGNGVCMCVCLNNKHLRWILLC